ncbi:MAG: class I SAM-dependent methyltransferase [Candidatus Andersenbacteria bacterium]
MIYKTLLVDKYGNTKSVYDQISSKYLAGVSDSFPQELPEFIAKLRQGSKVLEVGTAGGRDAKVFVDAGMTVVGTDVVDSFLREAEQLVPQAQFFNKDMRHLDFPDGEFDAIWANAVLLHAEREDVPSILQNFWRILKTGGKVHIRVKQGEGEEYREEKLSDNKKRFFVYYSPIEMEKLLENAGFQIIRSEVMEDERGRRDTKWVSTWGEKI